MLAGLGLFFERGIFSFQGLDLGLQLAYLPLQFFHCHGVSLGCGREVHGYGVVAVGKFHRPQAVDGGLRRAQQGHMTQRHTVRHEAHAHMPVMAGTHESAYLFRHLGKLRQQPAALTFQALRPAERRGRIRLRVAEYQRSIPFLRIVGAGDGVQVLFRKRLLPPGAVREGARAGYLDPFVHSSAPGFSRCDAESYG